MRSALEGRTLESFSDLERAGIVQRFEYTFELAWKTIKDYLEFGGLTLDQVTPREAIKQAFAAKVVDDGQTWLDMLAHRNLISHTYDPKKFRETVEAIRQRYLAAFEQIYGLLKVQVSQQ